MTCPGISTRGNTFSETHFAPGGVFCTGVQG